MLVLAHYQWIPESVQPYCTDVHTKLFSYSVALTSFFKERDRKVRGTFESAAMDVGNNLCINSSPPLQLDLEVPKWMLRCKVPHV